MLVRNVKKLLGAGLALVLTVSMSACSSIQDVQDSTEPVKILCPTGAPALAMLGAEGLENVTIEYVEGSDVLTAELAKEDGEYDIIVAPTNLGAKIYPQSQTYQMEAVLTWGNLYLVGTQGTDLSTASIGAFGENAVPGLVFNAVEPEGLNVTWYPAVAEANQALLTGQVDVALLAQPAAAAAIAKGKESGKEFVVLQDLQALWQQKTNGDADGYPQASLFVKQGNKEKVDRVLDAVDEFIDDAQKDNLTAKIEEVGYETLGLPSTEIAVNTWDAQNIEFEEASDCVSEISSFLSVFGIELPDGLILD